MKILKSVFGLKGVGDGSLREAVWIWLALSVWLPYVASGVIMVGVFFVILIDDRARAAVLSQKRMFLLGAVIAGFSFLSALFSLNYIGMLIALGVFIVITEGCYLRSTVDRGVFDKSAAILALGSLSGFISAIIQREIIEGGAKNYRPVAGAFNANYYGNLIAFTVILCAIRFMEKSSDADGSFRWDNFPKWVWLIFGLVNVAALLYSRSRSSLLAVMVCAIIYLVLSKRIWLTLICFVGFGGVCALGFLRPDIFNWENTLSFIFEERAEIWRSAIGYSLSSPKNFLIGNGPMTYFHVMHEAGLFIAHHAHNIIFDTLINVGVIGLALYALLILEILRASLGNFKEKGREWILCTVIVAEILVQGLADVTIMWLQTSVMFMLLVFPAVLPKKNKEEE